MPLQCKVHIGGLNLQKLVDKINAILLKIFAIVKSTIKKATPNIVKDLQLKFRKKKEEKKKEIIEKMGDIKDKAVTVSNKSQKELKNIKRVTSKKVRQTNEWIENFSFKKIDFKEIFKSLYSFISILSKKVITFFRKMPKEKIKNILIASSLLTIILLIGYNSLNQIVKERTGKDIFTFKKEKKKGPDTSDYIKRPDYFLGEKKQFSLQNIDLPIYVESINAIRMLTFDFTVEGSNRYIAAYFSSRVNENLIKDQLNNSVQPIVPTFPLKEEGKRIIKLKIKEEINVLVQRLKIKGHISKVYINNVLAN